MHRGTVVLVASKHMLLDMCANYKLVHITNGREITMTPSIVKNEMLAELEEATLTFNVIKEPNAAKHD